MNKSTFLLLLFGTELFLHHKVSALKCYTCSTYNAEVCRLEQQLESSQLECGARTTCVTMVYTQLSNGEKMNRFIKKCGIPGSQRCQDNCQNVEHLVPNSCKTSCCSGNLCNEEVNQEVIWYALIGTPNLSQRICQGKHYFTWMVGISLFLILLM